MTNKEHAEREQSAAQAADNLLMDAMEAVPEMRMRMNAGVSASGDALLAFDAALVSAHALVAKLDAMETSKLAAHGELIAVLEKIAGRLAVAKTRSPLDALTLGVGKMKIARVMPTE